MTFYTNVFRYPCCTPQVLDILDRKYAATPHPTSQRPLFPRRLVRDLKPPKERGWTPEDHPLPFLRHIYARKKETWPDINAYEGYALTRAVRADFVPLVRFLLDHGASPKYGEGIAVLVAIQKKSLSMVKMLIERPQSDVQPGKRRKLADRINVTKDMLKLAAKCKANDIIEYLMKDKDCVPDMETILIMDLFK